jgi:hypothetical protein
LLFLGIQTNHFAFACGFDRARRFSRNLIARKMAQLSIVALP